jgi:hypothetical protein
MGRQEYLFGPDKRPAFTGSVIDFLGHVIGSTMIFLVIVLLGWLVSVAIHSLHEIHHFSAELLMLFTDFELYLGYVDLGLFALFLTIATARFLRELWEK